MSKYFKLQELVCKHCGVAGAKPELFDALDIIREIYGKPIIIASGYRCESHNNAVGGVPESAHVTGEAADLGCTFAVDRMALIKAALSAGITRIGVAKNFVHMDISSSLPQEVFWLY